MSLTKIEEFLFGGDCAHFVTAFISNDRETTMVLKPMEDNRADGATKVIATFANVVMLSCEKDPDGTLQFPFDPIGFASYPDGERWRFVLNCGVVEWIWKSSWPKIELETKPGIRSIFDLGRSDGSNIAKDKDRMIAEAFGAARRRSDS